MRRADCQGAEINALAEQFGIDRNTVMAHLKRNDVAGHRWRGRTLNPEQLEEAGLLYETGINLIACATPGEVVTVDGPQ